MVNSITRRKFTKVFSEFSDQMSELYLKQFGIDDEIKPENRLNKILEKWNLDSTSDFKKIWQLVELGILSNSWLDLYSTQSKYNTLKKLKSLFTSEKFTSNNLTILKLNKKPAIFVIFYFAENKRSLIDRANLSNYQRECVYYIPEHSIVLTRVHDDEVGIEFMNIVKEKFDGLTPFRTKTMIISKFYNNTLNINDLHVMSDHQVAGFSGMDQIAFHGDHIKQGLYGLHKRQDIRVNLDQIGPRIEVSGQNLHLKIGPKVRVKTPLGFKELADLIEEFH